MRLKIPDEFRELPEALRLRQAESQLSAAIEQEKRLTEASGERVHLISERLRQAQEELQTAQNVFDAATGEPKPVGLTSTVLDEIAKHFPAEQHQQVRELLDRACGRTIPFRREATVQQLEYIRLCVLRLSKGDLSDLVKWVELANIDERDVVGPALPLMEHDRNY